MSDEDFAPFVAPVSFSRFMHISRNDSARELVDSIIRFIEKFKTKKRHPEKDSKALQDFLLKTEADFKKHKVWKNTPQHELHMMMEGVEKYVTVKLYDVIFGRYPEDRERDQAISDRMAALIFVQAEHLDIPDGIITEESVIAVTKELQRMNSHKCPRDKLICILNCCRMVSNTLRAAGRAGDGADMFVPVMNYVVIRAQPDKLMSNIEFVRRFRKQSQLVSLAEYYFMQLSVSALFIETANAESFTKARQQFLNSFLERRLISWEQYQEAMNTSESTVGANASDVSGVSGSQQQVVRHSRPPVHPSGKAEQGLEPGQTDQAADAISKTDNSSVSSMISGSKSFQGANEISWERVASFSELEVEGSTLAAQLTAEGEMVRRHPLMTVAIESLTLGQVETLLSEYRCFVLGYEVLREATMHKDSPTIIRLLEEGSDGWGWKSVWPSKTDLLLQYPFLSAQSPTLTFSDTSRLLLDYKEVVLKYEILELALRRRIRPVDSSRVDTTALIDYEPEVRLPEIQEREREDPQVSVEGVCGTIKEEEEAEQSEPQEEKVVKNPVAEFQVVEAVQDGENVELQEAPPPVAVEEAIMFESVKETPVVFIEDRNSNDKFLNSFHQSQEVEWDEGPSSNAQGNAETLRGQKSISETESLPTCRPPSANDMIDTLGETSDQTDVEPPVEKSCEQSEFVFNQTILDREKSLDLLFGEKGFEVGPAPTTGVGVGAVSPQDLA